MYVYVMSCSDGLGVVLWQVNTLTTVQRSSVLIVCTQLSALHLREVIHGLQRIKYLNNPNFNSVAEVLIVTTVGCCPLHSLRACTRAVFVTRTTNCWRAFAASARVKSTPFVSVVLRRLLAAERGALWCYRWLSPWAEERANPFLCG